jgi:two-component system, OmpR family, alkaline phosphatase synthesis response regulator PhoP
MNPKRLLMIDDDETIQAVAKFGIDMTVGWELLLASSGLIGIDMAIREQPDGILLDMIMPEMDGIATFQALQSNPSTVDIPVIFLTGKTQNAVHQRVEALGCRGIITKPFNTMNLTAQIVKILNW